MAEEEDRVPTAGDDEGGGLGEARSDALAARIAMSASSDTAEEAREYLRKQSRLADLQIENLQKQDRYELSHLRFRRFSDFARAALESVVAAVILVALAGLVVLVWQARSAGDLIIKPIKAPPDFAQRGLDGTVLAQKLLDKLNGLVTRADNWSFRAADTVSGDWGEDSKVEIPETGISISELSRYLHETLGHETTMSGELYRTNDGVALTVRAGSGIGMTFSGRDGDVDGLLDRAAHALLSHSQPYRYLWLLFDEGRPPTSIVPIARHLAESATAAERPWIQSVWEEQLEFGGDFRAAAALSGKTIAFAPDNPSGYIDLAPAQWALGRLQPALDSIETAHRLLSNRPGADFASGAVPFLLFNCESFADDLRGAYGDAIAADIEESKTGRFDFNVSGPATLANDLVQNHDVRSARDILAKHGLANDEGLLKPQYIVTTGPVLPNFFLRAAVDDWAGARDALAQTDRAVQIKHDIEDVRRTLILPWLAYAMAKTGHMNEAKALVAQTPLDCTLCLEMRGRIAELSGDDDQAISWFNRAVADALSLPFSYTDWGRLLLRRGDIDAAIEKLRTAHDKSPHNADALELWGEALVNKNRSDLALAKFEEAAKYAPNWGRLHLKWGEALWWSGKRDEARAQFAAATRLDLTSPEKSELTKVQGMHG